MVGAVLQTPQRLCTHSLVTVYMYISALFRRHIVSASQRSCISLVDCGQAVLQSGLVCMCLQEDRKSQRSQPKDKKGFDHKIEGVFVRKSNKKENPRVVSRIFGRRQFIFAAFFLLRKSRTIKNCCVYEFESRVSCLVFSSNSHDTHQHPSLYHPCFATRIHARPVPARRHHHR